MYNEFNGQNYPDAGMTGLQILETYEIEDVNPTENMLVLIGYAAVIHLFSFLVLWGKHAWHLRSNNNKAASGAGKGEPAAATEEVKEQAPQ